MSQNETNAQTRAANKVPVEVALRCAFVSLWSITGSLERISQCKEDFHQGFPGFVRPSLPVQIESKIQTCRPNRRLISQPETNVMLEIPETDIRNARKYIPCIIKECAADAADRKNAERNAVFEICNRHDVSAGGIRFIQTESTQGRGAAGVIAFSGGQFLRLTGRELIGEPVWVVPAEAERSRKDTVGRRGIKTGLVEE